MRKVVHGWLVNFTDDNGDQQTLEYCDKEYMMAHLSNDIENSSMPENVFIIPPGEAIKAIDFLKRERKKENYFKKRYQNILGNYVIGLEKFPIKFDIGDLHQSDYAVTGDFADYQGVLSLKNGGYIEVWAALEYKEHESGATGAFLNSIIFEDNQQNIYYENENLMSAFMLQKLGFFVKDVVDVIFDEDELLNENEREIYYSFGFCPRLK
jgi:hypothetical protein